MSWSKLSTLFAHSLLDAHCTVLCAQTASLMHLIDSRAKEPTSLTDDLIIIIIISELWKSLPKKDNLIFTALFLPKKHMIFIYLTLNTTFYFLCMFINYNCGGNFSGISTPQQWERKRGDVTSGPKPGQLGKSFNVGSSLHFHFILYNHKVRRASK